MKVPSIGKTLIFGASSQICLDMRRIMQRENIAQPFYHHRHFHGVLRTERDVNLELTSEAMSDFAKEHSIDNLVILSGSKSNKEDDLLLNAAIIKKYLEITANIPLKKILIMSSSSVYGAYKNVPFKESDECRPVTIYGKSKFLMEKVAYENYQKFENTHCLRLANFLGGDSLAKNFQTYNHVKITQYEDKKGPLRTYVSASQILSALMQLLTTEKKLPFAINVGNATPIHMEKLASLTAMKWSFTKETQNCAAQKIVLDCSVLTSLVRLEEIVYETIAEK